MTGSVNKVILVGNLGADPEVRTFQSGGKVCNFSIATSESWKDRETGERQERTQWHRVAIFSEPLAKIAEQYLRKGSKVYVEGQLETNKWKDRSGQDRYTTEVVLRPYRSGLTLLDRRGDNVDGESGDSEDGQRRGYAQRRDPRPAQSSSPAPTQSGQAPDGSKNEVLDDEIPF